MFEIVLLDAATLGGDMDLSVFEQFGRLTVYQTSAPSEIADRAADADVILTNKCRLNAETLQKASHLKLICVAATGFDNIDTAYCRSKNIGVTNVKGYSTDSVAQLTVGMVLNLIMHLVDFNAFVRDGSYTASGVPNRLFPAFRELRGKTWGIVGAGNIGGQVARVAEALGAHVVVCRRSQDPVYETLPLDELCRVSDIISLHVPLNDSTRGMIGRKQLALMKDGVILVNVARGAVTDEAAVAEAVQSGRIGGLGVDVYSAEPMPADHPLYPIKDDPNVFLTPHMAWGAYEARKRCLAEMCENIAAYLRGEKRCRVD